MAAKATTRAQAAPFLMFNGRAAEAVAFYLPLFEDNELLVDDRYGPEGPGAEGTVREAAFRIAGQTIRCADGVGKHEAALTPAMSISVDCVSKAEIDALAAALADGGAELVPLGGHGPGRRFAWIRDKFGVGWRLNLR